MYRNKFEDRENSSDEEELMAEDGEESQESNIEDGDEQVKVETLRLQIKILAVVVDS